MICITEHSPAFTLCNWLHISQIRVKRSNIRGQATGVWVPGAGLSVEPVSPAHGIVYVIASVVVLYNVEEEQQRHNDDVKCLAVHPDMVTIATGQVAGSSKDGKQLPPHVRVWDSVSLNTLHVVGMGVFDRAVTCVGFSKSNGGTHLCAVDYANDHIMSVWEWQKEKKLAEVKCSNDSVLSANFHPMDSNLILTCGKSHLNFWTVEDSTLTKTAGPV
ncbi:echinoderm microtubule-associated protein-like 1 [Acipenser ruthenus]|uniref:echinoderm microtubule-associated protein-like 1 n=1 Tax=Acipenser ruthenus TaxID=7906 RepID=UPI002741C090|nr:echinoderm microtubule-associated protein-like 1 [Acipenser ruthenus]